MSEFYERVIDEKKTLDERLLKLLAFLYSVSFADLEAGEQDRLLRQAEAMTAYSVILGERITANGWDRKTIKMVRNTVSGLEFAATPDLLRFAKNKGNNLEVFEIPAEEPAAVEEPAKVFGSVVSDVPVKGKGSAKGKKSVKPEESQKPEDVPRQEETNLLNQ